MHKQKMHIYCKKNLVDGVIIRRNQLACMRGQLPATIPDNFETHFCNNTSISDYLWAGQVKLLCITLNVPNIKLYCSNSSVKIKFYNKYGEMKLSFEIK